MGVLLSPGTALFQGTIQTVGVQSKTLASYRVNQNSIVNLMVYFTASDSGYTLGRSGYLSGTALRAAGNVSLSGTPILDATGSLTITIGLSANTTTQAIDIVVTGILATTINYQCMGYPTVIN